MRRRALGASVMAAAAALVLAGGAAAAPPADYDPASREWNGLSELMKIAAARGFEVEPVTTLDWSDLGADDTLAVVYPARDATPSPSDVLRFLASGGRLLVADDFGGAEPLLRGLEMERGAPPDADAFYGDDPALPWAHATDPRHVLAAGGATAILTNHPAYLRTALPPVFVFGGEDSDHAAVVEGKYGEGLFVAVSDPSILINAMLRLPANRAFAANLLERVAGIHAVPPPAGADAGVAAAPADDGAGAGASPPRRRVVLAWGDFAERGTYDAGDQGDLADRLGLWMVAAHVRSFGKWLASLAGRPLPGLVVRLIGLLALLVAGAIALGALPIGRRHYDGDWFGRGSAAPHRALVARQDLRSAARVLEEDVLMRLLGHGESDPAALAAARAAQSPERLADEILARAARTPARPGAAPAAAPGAAPATPELRRRLVRTLVRLQRLSLASYDVTLRTPEPAPAEFLAVYRECRDLVERLGKSPHGSR